MDTRQKFLKGLIFVMFSALYAFNAKAENFVVDGLYYSTLSESTVQVVKPISGSYTGTITIPEKVTYNGIKYWVTAIGDNAFKGAHDVTSVTLPLTTITSIGEYAFNDCTGLTEFTLPASIISIGQKAFYYCDNLKHLYVHHIYPASYHSGTEAFSKIHYGSHVCTLHVPTGCMATYAADATFSVFTLVEEFDPPQVYSLWVGGTQVTDVNASDILGDGVASYDASTNMLTIGGDIMATGSDNYGKGIFTSIDDLVIQVSKPTTITSTEEGMLFWEAITITGSSLLTITSSNDVALLGEATAEITIKDANMNLNGQLKSSNKNTLTIQSSTVDVSTTSPYGAISGWKELALDGCYIDSPEEGVYDTTDKRVEDKIGNIAKTVSVKPGIAPVFYDLYVVGIHVNSNNASNILGDGVASYDASTKTLTIGGDITATGLGGYGIGIDSHYSDLTVQVSEPTTITSTEEGMLFWGATTITGSALLTIRSANDAAIYGLSAADITIKDANLDLIGQLKSSNSNTLTIQSSSVDVSTDSSNGAINGWKELTLDGCYFDSPEEGVYDTTDKRVEDKNNDIAKMVIVKVDNNLAFIEISATATVGQSFTEPTLSNPHSLTVTYKSDKPSVATVDENTGEVTPISVGTATITASFVGNKRYGAGNVSYELTVEPRTVDAPTIILSETSFVYDGQEKEPTVTVKDGETTIPSSEYTVSYMDNIYVGTATVTVEDVLGGNYIVSNSSTTFVIQREIAGLFSDSYLWAGYMAQEDLALPTGLTAYVVTELGETSATATEIDYIPQYVPVLLKREDAAVNNYKASAGSGSAPDKNLLNAYTVDYSAGNCELYVLFRDEFVLASEGTLPAGKVFLNSEGSAPVRKRSIVTVNGETNGIADGILSKDATDGQWFDMQGRRLIGKPARKGVYIQNGRKVVVK